MKLPYTPKELTPLLLLLVLSLALVAAAVYVEHSNANDAAYGAELARAQRIGATADPAEVIRARERRAVAMALQQAESERQRDAELAAMTCSQLHVERAAQAAAPLSLQTFTGVLDAYRELRPGERNFDLNDIIAELGPRFSEIPNTNTDPVDAEIEARCLTRTR